MFQYICYQCGKAIKKEKKIRGKNAYCSPKCYHKSTKQGKILLCKGCNKSFYLNKSRVARNEKYCSSKCYKKARTPKKVTKICPVCTKSFQINKSISHRYTVCSLACRWINMGNIICKRCKKVFRDKIGIQTYCSEKCYRPPTYKTCEQCAKQFRVMPYAKDIRRFCSFSCYRKFTGETSLEKLFRLSLYKLGIPFIQEGQVGRYSVDFLLPKYKIALEADGAYWHSNAQRDKRKNNFLIKNGWKVVRILDTEITHLIHPEIFILLRLNEISNIEISRT